MQNTAASETAAPKTVAGTISSMGGDATGATSTNGLASTASPFKGGKKSRRKSRKVNGAAKLWVNFVLDVFRKNRAKNPSYKYKQAMKDAAKLKKKNKTAKA